MKIGIPKGILPGETRVAIIPETAKRRVEKGAQVGGAAGAGQAAAIAAYVSKGQGSSLVRVIMAPRKYVRKPKGAPPGAVVVEREEVLLVEPRLPLEGRGKG